MAHGRQAAQDVADAGTRRMERPRGTRDFAPADVATRRSLEARMHGVLRRHGYHEVQTPTFEHLELFTAKSGPSVVAELYRFQDKADRDLCLRPELTAPVMRMYHAGHAFTPKPLKWYYFGNCFRYDRPQSGRYREFWQFGCELIGAGTPLAHAELIGLAAALMDEAGLRSRQLRVGHVGVLGALVDALGLEGEPRAAAMRHIDKGDLEALRAHVERHASGSMEALEGLLEALGADDALAVSRALEGLAPGPDRDRAEAALAELTEVLDLVASFGVDDARLDVGIARGLDYYTGPVFEAHCPLLEAQSQILGGGAYDLSGVFGGPPTATLGFGLGFDRLLVALEAEGQEAVAPPGPAVYLAGLSEEGTAVAVRVATELRRAGVPADLDLMGRKPAQVARHADAVAARFLVVVGPRDLQAGHVQVKGLADGTTWKVPLDGLAAWLQERS